MRQEIKQALNAKYGFTKKADALSDYMSSAGPISGIGSIIGALDTPASEEERADMDRSALRGALLPGVGAYRTERRMKGLLTNDKGNTPHYWAQKFAPTLQSIGLPLILGGIGYSIPYMAGARYDKALNKGFATGAGIGAGIGLLSNLGGAIGAGLTRRRTAKEQKDYANSSSLKDWLVPGHATYNYWKTMGRNIGDSEERTGTKKDETEKA